MAAPAFTFYEVTAGGNDNIPEVNLAGGPVASTISPYWDFSNVQAGAWSTPQVLVFYFDGNTAQQVRFRLYDHESNLEEFYPGDATDWDFRICLKANWVDPTGITDNDIEQNWAELPHGDTGIIFDPGEAGTAYPTDNGGNGNDDTDSLLVLQNGESAKYFTNFYIYVAFKPESNAIAGEHTGWSYRANYVYPAA